MPYKRVESLKKLVVNKSPDTCFDIHHEESSLDEVNHQPSFLLGSHWNTSGDMHSGYQGLSWKCINLMVMNQLGVFLKWITYSSLDTLVMVWTSCKQGSSAWMLIYGNGGSGISTIWVASSPRLTFLNPFMLILIGSHIS